MSKAFTREPDAVEPVCPPPVGCGAAGIPVGRKTLFAQLPEELARAFADAAYYCPNPRCSVAYYDAWGAQAPASAVKNPAYPKNPAAPICRCFGVMAQEISDDAEAGRKDRIRELLARAESSEARCETEAPCGRSCVAEVRKVFLKHFAGS
jgi:hypothetical protein